MSIDAQNVRGPDAAEAAGDPSRWIALPVLLTGAFLPILDFNVVNLALPEISRDLGATASDTQFVISAYAATYAVFLITGGRLGDWLGRKRMFMAGVAGFTLASVLCGVAGSPGVLIAGRMLQGLTATVMAPQVLASIRVLFPAGEQGTALGLYGAVFGLANIAGQILGGVLVTIHPLGLAWQAIFLVNVPIGAAAFFGSLRFLGDSRADHAQRLDIGGVMRLSAALGLLVYPLIEGRGAGWPLWIIAMLVASPFAFLIFVRYEHRLARRGGAPLVDLALFREPGLAVGVAMALLYYMLSSFYLTFSVYLQGGLKLTPLDAGMRTLPFAIGYFAASFVAARFMRWLGSRALTLGFGVQVLGFGSVIWAVSAARLPLVESGLFVAGLGYGLVMPSVIKAVIGGVEPRHAGLASGVVISTFQIGAALGVAIIGGVFYSALGAAHDLTAYTDAFVLALSCNVVLLIVGGILSTRLPR
ncbi:MULTISPECIES: MFS transporter [Pandoraea]|uniref:MFS transporter n=1 Tax=Pandoraea TaxID=93217 RepID=UPI001F5C7205|nr:MULTISPECIES: MFS transporter [Pandoraea]MCI3206500.1 MFS transporter [Pandoraea sp. LA3]MDN4584528.1 MFS transporter [Pandoraea capi]